MDERSKILKKFNQSERAEQFADAFEAAKQLVSGAKPRFEFEVYGTKSVGTIIIETKECMSVNPDVLTKVCEFASNMEVVSEIDGTMVMNISFYGL